MAKDERKALVELRRSLLQEARERLRTETARLKEDVKVRERERELAEAELPDPAAE